MSEDEGVTPLQAAPEAAPARVTPVPGKGALGTRWPRQSVGNQTQSWVLPGLRRGEGARQTPSHWGEGCASTAVSCAGGRPALRNGVQSRGQNRAREIRPSGIVEGLQETWPVGEMNSTRRARLISISTTRARCPLSGTEDGCSGSIVHAVGRHTPRRCCRARRDIRPSRSAIPPSPRSAFGCCRRGVWPAMPKRLRKAAEPRTCGEQAVQARSRVHHCSVSPIRCKNSALEHFPATGAKQRAGPPHKGVR